jgi:primosomal protein N' (replication factor Y)
MARVASNAEKAVRAPLLFEEPPAPEPPPAGPLVDVVLDRPLDQAFTYSVPPALAAAAAPGVRVAVPFSGRREVGVVCAAVESSSVDRAKLKPVARVLDREPIVPRELFELTRWMARRYACAWGECLHGVLPPALKRENASRTVLVVSAVDGVGQRELDQLERENEKQRRTLRTLLDAGGPLELRELVRKLGTGDAPVKSAAPVRKLERRGWVRIEAVEPARDELEVARVPRPRPARLAPAQATAIERIGAALAAGQHRTFLLHGVTGSGKTEVYLVAIERALALGRGAIVLVPEIALTPQTVGWFRSRFDQVAVLHSHMTDAQRLRAWRSVQRGEARVVVGARSAVFAPVARLGVIVVDEEHEPSFKQASTPRYHARDVAVERARAASAVCVLGSATPSLESWRAARDGAIELVSLPERIGGRPLPPVEVIDLRGAPRAKEGGGLFSRRLAILLQETLARGEQAILFLNRRSFAPVLWCGGCKETVRCASCDVSLAWHRRIHRLVCHSCGEERAVPRACPTCTRPGLSYLGAGSEKVEHELAALAPSARVRRMDSDTMLRREDYERTLGAFGAGEIDVLVGTQMIAKGLDFPRVTLVGIVSADAALHLPDFRASERTFQLIAQVAGRAGRGELPGRIVVQTLVPEHPAIARAAAHDFEGFAADESEARAVVRYPPHGRLARLVFEDEDEARAIQSARACAQSLRERLSGARAQVLGPAPAPIALARGRHRQHVLVKLALDAETLETVLGALRVVAAASARPRALVDVDPVSLL